MYQIKLFKDHQHPVLERQVNGFLAGIAPKNVVNVKVWTDEDRYKRTGIRYYAAVQYLTESEED